MMSPLRTVVLLALALAWVNVGIRAHSQALPTVVRSGPHLGFELPTVEGNLKYSLTASETITFGYDATSQTASSTNIGGNLAYISNGTRHPFSVVYSGAYLFNTTGQPSSLIQSLAFSQVYKTARWNFVGSDTVSYLPQAPTAGLAGIPGLGDQYLNPVLLGSPVGQGVVSNYSPRLVNTASLSASRDLTGSTSLQSSGNYTTLRFIGGSSDLDANTAGIDSNSLTANLGVNHRIDARDNVGANFGYSHYAYSGVAVVLVSETLSASFTRQLSRRATASVAAGPQRTTSNNEAVAPTSTSLFANASLGYTVRSYNASVQYGRSTNSGLGIVVGARSDYLTGNLAKTLARGLTANIASNYTRSASLSTALLTLPTYSSVSITGGIQYNRQIAHYVSAYASYYASRQLLQGNVSSPLLLNGFNQTLGFGLTYAPDGLNFGHRN